MPRTLRINYGPAENAVKKHLDQYYYQTENLWRSPYDIITDRQQECYKCMPKNGSDIPITIFVSYTPYRIAVYELKDPIELKCPKLEREKEY